MAIEQDPAHVDEALGPPEQGSRWLNKAAALVYVFFCFEIGVFLLVFPWIELWQRNFLAGFTPGWYEWWNSPYLRGAVSGLGLVDIGIAFCELVRMRRFAQRSRPDSVQ